MEPTPQPFAMTTNAAPKGGEFFSAFGINDDVYFRPMYRHQQAMGIADEEIGGRVVAVKFTEEKAWYDVLSTYHGCIFDGVDSGKVSGLPDYAALPVLEAVPTQTEVQVQNM